jgi:mannose-1-phosphate guanylyltransferase
VSIFGGWSHHQAVQRIVPFTESHGLHILTSELLLDELRTTSPLSRRSRGSRSTTWPNPRPATTAPAIALAAAHLSRIDPDAIMVSSPSDHLLEDGERWQRHPRCRSITALATAAS